MATAPKLSYCLRHPEQETYLSCGRCRDPVCAWCMVHTDVGVRCPSCVGYARNPIYQVSVPLLGKAIGVGVGLGLFGGVAWGLIGAIFPFFLVRLLIVVGLGSVIGSAISLTANRKRGLSLQIIAAGSVVLSFFLASLLNPFLNPLSLWSLGTLVAGMIAAITALR